MSPRVFHAEWLLRDDPPAAPTDLNILNQLLTPKELG